MGGATQRTRIHGPELLHLHESLKSRDISGEAVPEPSLFSSCDRPRPSVRLRPLADISDSTLCLHYRLSASSGAP